MVMDACMISRPRMVLIFMMERLVVIGKMMVRGVVSGGMAFMVAILMFDVVQLDMVPCFVMLSIMMAHVVVVVRVPLGRILVILLVTHVLQRVRQVVCRLVQRVVMAHPVVTVLVVGNVLIPVLL